MDVIFEADSDELSTSGPDNTDGWGHFVGIKVLPINTTFDKCLDLDGFCKDSMFVFEIESSEHFGFSFDEEKDLVEHIALVNNNFVLIEFAELWYGRDHSDHKIGLVLRLLQIYLKVGMGSEVLI